MAVTGSQHGFMCVDAGHGCRRYDLGTGSHTGCHDPASSHGGNAGADRFERDGNSFIHKSTGLVRTARKLAEGVLYAVIGLGSHGAADEGRYPDDWFDTLRGLDCFQNLMALM